MGRQAGALSGPSRPRGKRTLWQWVRDVAITIVTALAILIFTVPINLYLSWRRYLLRREVRLHWGPRPHVIVHAEGKVWSLVLNDRWLPTATERTLVLGAFPSSVETRGALPLEWRVYREWGPNFKSVLPPVALVVRRDGLVERIDFHNAIMDLALHGDDTLMTEQLDELARLSHRT